jgi:FkbM family methyltransferase
MKIPPPNAVLSGLKSNVAFRRMVSMSLGIGPNTKLELFGSPVTVDPRWELGYALAAKQQRFSTAIRNDVPILISLAGLLTAQDTFLDIGANVGLYSSVLSRMAIVYPSMSFHAFEANPETTARLLRSLEGCGVMVHRHGLSDRNGEISFSRARTSGLFRASADPHGQTIACPVRRLDDCAIAGSSLVLKIDVEGHEYQVLKGAEATFSSGRVRAVYVDGYDDPRVAEFLRTRGFRFFNGRTMQPVDAGGTPWLLGLADSTVK